MKRTDFTILVVDDDPNDQYLIRRALKKNAIAEMIQVVSSGAEAVSYLKGEGKFSDRAKFQYPSFVITDLKMSPGDGFSVLEHLKNRPERAVIPTVVLSASADSDDIKKSYMLGASAYLVKPNSSQELLELLTTLYKFWVTCEIPEVDATGKRLMTHSRGKLGERFLQ